MCKIHSVSPGCFHKKNSEWCQNAEDKKEKQSAF